MRDLVRDIDRDADGARTRRHGVTGLAGSGADNCNDMREIGSQRIAGRVLDARHGRRIEAGHIILAVGRKPAHARLRRQQQTKFRLRKFALAGQDDRSGVQIEEQGQKPHAKLRFPICGVD